MLTQLELDALALDLCPPDPAHLVIVDGSPDHAPCPKCGGTDNSGAGSDGMMEYECRDCDIIFTAVSKAALAGYRERQERLRRLLAQAALALKLTKECAALRWCEELGADVEFNYYPDSLPTVRVKCLVDYLMDSWREATAPTFVEAVAALRALVEEK